MYQVKFIVLCLICLVAVNGMGIYSLQDQECKMITIRPFKSYFFQIHSNGRFNVISNNVSRLVSQVTSTEFAISGVHLISVCNPGPDRIKVIEAIDDRGLSYYSIYAITMSVVGCLILTIMFIKFCCTTYCQSTDVKMVVPKLSFYPSKDQFLT